jgi:GDP-4-dehydro-6-deoxy-D-mannose reductase
MKRVLILGAAGFSGSYLARHFLDNPGQDWVPVLADSRPLLNRIDGATFHQVDATDRNAIRDLILALRPEGVVNLVGMFSAADWVDYYRVNVEATVYLLETILEAGLSGSRILLIGSAAEYGKPIRNPINENDILRPVTYYGLSKVMQTQLGLFYAEVKGLAVIMARTFNITGLGISPALSVGSFAKQIAEAPDGGTITVGNLESERDFLPIEEVARRYSLLLRVGTAGEVYNVCSGQPTRMGAMVQKMIIESGKDLRVEVDPSRFKSGDVPCIYGDSAKFDDLERFELS